MQYPDIGADIPGRKLDGSSAAETIYLNTGDYRGLGLVVVRRMRYDIHLTKKFIEHLLPDDHEEYRFTVTKILGEGDKPPYITIDLNEADTEPIVDRFVKIMPSMARQRLNAFGLGDSGPLIDEADLSGRDKWEGYYERYTRDVNTMWMVWYQPQSEVLARAIFTTIQGTDRPTGIRLHGIQRDLFENKLKKVKDQAWRRVPNYFFNLISINNR